MFVNSRSNWYSLD